MYIVGKALFGLGILAYVIALCYMGSVTAEIFSDLGNGIMLGTAVLLLLGLTKKMVQKENAHPADRNNERKYIQEGEQAAASDRDNVQV